MRRKGKTCSEVVKKGKQSGDNREDLKWESKKETMKETRETDVSKKRRKMHK